MDEIPSKLTPQISDLRLTRKNESLKGHRIAQEEHDRVMAFREQSHSHSMSREAIACLTSRMKFAQIASFSMCILLLGLFVLAIYALLSGQLTVTPGLGFTLGIISSVFGNIFHTLIKKMWDFNDLPKTLVN